MVDVQTEIRAEQLPDTSRKHYHLSQLSRCVFIELSHVCVTDFHYVCLKAGVIVHSSFLILRQAGRKEDVSRSSVKGTIFMLNRPRNLGHYVFYRYSIRKISMYVIKCRCSVISSIPVSYVLRSNLGPQTGCYDLFMISLIPSTQLLEYHIKTLEVTSFSIHAVSNPQDIIVFPVDVIQLTQL
jgi:hypothetical protein